MCAGPQGVAVNKAGKAPALSLPCLRALLSFVISDGKQSRHRGEIPFSKMCSASGTEVMGVPEFLEAGVVRALDRLPSVLSHEGCCSLRPQGLGASFDHSESHLPLACEVHLLDRGPPFESRLFSRGDGAAPSLMAAFHTEYCVPGAPLGAANRKASKTPPLLSRSSFFGGNKYEK